MARPRFQATMGTVLDFLRKSKIAISLLRNAPNWRARVSMFGNMYRANRLSNLAEKLDPHRPDKVQANAWAEYFLLNYVDRPIPVEIDPKAKPRIWFVVPQLDPTVIFGGYIALIQLVRFLQAKGFATGFLVQNGFESQEALLTSFSANKMVHPVLLASELVALDPNKTLPLGAGDMLVSYNWTTSLVCSKISRHLNCRSYYYFVQEDERIFYVNDSTRFLAESIYTQDPPPKLICNSQALYRHLLREGLIGKDTEAMVFEQSISPANLSQLAGRRSASPRKFVFYGRPEDHAKRNLFTIALMAIARAAKDGAFAAEPWEFYMMGSDKMGESFDLEGITIKGLPRMDYETYGKALADFDLAMVLMYAPHPSVPPFELVQSGVITVVNTKPSLDHAWYKTVSENFEPAIPNVDALAQALKTGAARVADVDARAAAAHTYHPKSWDESFAHLPAAILHPIFRAYHKRKS